MDDLDEFSSDVLTAAAGGKPPSGPRGSYVGDPSAVVSAIGNIKDPRERANAMAAFTEQARRTPGFAQGKPFQSQGAASSDGLDDFSSHALTTAATQATTPSPAKGPQPQITSPEFDMTAHVLSSVGSTIAGGYSGIYHGLKTLIQTGDKDKALTDAASAVDRTRDAGTWTPRTPQGQQMAEQFGSNANPIAWVPNAAAYVGDRAGGALADRGAPGLGAVVNGTINAAPMALGFRGSPLRELVNPTKSVPEPVRVEPTMNPPKPLYRLQDGKPVLVEQPLPNPTMAGPQKQAVPVSQSQPASTSRTAATQDAPAPPAAFSDIEPGTPIGDPKAPNAEMLRRAKVLQSVGIENARQSSLTGDKIGGSTDLQISKLDEPAGRYMNSVLEKEKQALADHATNLVDETGGTLNKDQTTHYQRGEAILAPLDQLRQHYDTRASQLYDSANQRAEGKPVALDNFRQMLADDSEMTSPDRLTFRDAAKAFAKKNNMLQEDGSISGNAMQAETFRKWLNKNRNYSNGSYVDALKGSLDSDVLSTAGEDIYSQARALWREKKETLDNPNGIAKVLEEEGLNRAIPKEQIAPKIARMPVDQFGHVVDTLKGVPEEIKPSATSALNEIRAHFSNEVLEAGSKHKGQWNASGVTKYLRDNAARMEKVFTPEEMAKYQNLSEAGQLVAKDQSYPGASVQERNLTRAGMGAAVRYGGAAVGGTVGGMFGVPGAGAAVGRYAGEKAAQGIETKASLRSAQKRTAKLSDLLGAGK